MYTEFLESNDNSNDEVFENDEENNNEEGDDALDNDEVIVNREDRLEIHPPDAAVCCSKYYKFYISIYLSYIFMVVIRLTLQMLRSIPLLLSFISSINYEYVHTCDFIMQENMLELDSDTETSSLEAYKSLHKNTDKNNQPTSPSIFDYLRKRPKQSRSCILFSQK